MIPTLVNRPVMFCLHLFASFSLLLPVVAVAAEEVSEIPILGPYAIFQALLSLVVVTILIFGTAWLLKRFNPALSQSGRGMKIISGLSLGGRDRLVLIEAGDRQLLLGVSPGRIMLVESFDEPVLSHEEQHTPVDEKLSRLFRRS